MKRYGWLLICVSAVPGLARGWTFSPVIDVMTLAQGYVHLESSGNRSIAVAGQTLAVAWEDNHSGQPRIYVAFKALNGGRFGKPLRISAAGPGYEPAITGLGDGRFVVVWEAGSRIWSRIISPTHQGSSAAVTSSTARQATLSLAGDGSLWLAWSQKAGQHFRILAARAAVRNNRLQVRKAQPVDPAPPTQDQQYPSIAFSHDGTSIAWEDRRYGHTRIFSAYAAKGAGFSRLQQLNTLPPPRSGVFGKGTGAMRVVLAGDGAQTVIASWLDKRNFAEGYDVYSAFSHDGGRHFGKNRKVEDMLGANQPQWHAVSAMDRAGHAVVAWDDQRDGSPDIWFSEYSASGWSDNDSPGAANGEGAQSHPGMVFDSLGRLHLVYIDRQPDATRLRYLSATR